jgi:hypothetical protein
MVESKSIPAKSEPRRILGQLVIVAATSLALGHCLRQPTQMGANDISRWCTVWSLLERGSYVIDECPWQIETQDKVLREPKGATGSSAAKHFYSSKPALLPTLIAGILCPARWATGVPLDHVVLQERLPRWTQQPDPTSPNRVKGVLETPKEPARWPAYIFYFKPIIVLLNVIPYGIFLILYTRLLDRLALGDWTWFFCLIAAAFATYLLPFTQTLNNHSVAASSVFFAIYTFLRIWDERLLSRWRFAAAGFFAAFAAANDLPALALLPLLFCLLILRHPRQTLVWFVPATLIPIGAFLAAQYAVFGELRVAYESFGGDEYLYEGSLWKTPLDLDAFNLNREPYFVYFFHMTLGHHGVLSLTPIFFFSAWGATRLIRAGGRLGSAFDTSGQPMVVLAYLTTTLTIIVMAFYTWNPKARNYGGSTQGLRWLLWMIPLWLLLLPKGVEPGETRNLVRPLALLALAVSVMSVGYAIRNPWSHPWILDALEHLDLYPLTR